MHALRRLIALATLTPLFLTGASAQVLIDFEGLPIGTVVTNQFPEVTFSSSAGNANSVTGPLTSGQFICTGPVGGLLNCVEDTYLDFSAPVSNLTFEAVEPNCACPNATFRIFQNGVFTATEELVGLGASGNKLVDLSAYANVTRLEIVDILDQPSFENGIGWDQFSFTPQPGPTVYCTSKTSSLGCTPSIDGPTATASVAAGSDTYDVHVGPVPGGPGNPAILVYTTNGPLANPLLGAYGWLCITPGPGFFRVLPAVFGGGTAGVCDGLYRWDFGAYLVTQTQDPNLVAGAQVDMQGWYRDPPNPGMANFTNAMSFALVP